MSAKVTIEADNKSDALTLQREIAALLGSLDMNVESVQKLAELRYTYQHDQCVEKLCGKKVLIEAKLLGE